MQGNKHTSAKRREKRVERILLKLSNQALKGGEEEDMSPTQMRAAELYLSRTRAALRQIEHKGEVDSKVEILIKRED